MIDLEIIGKINEMIYDVVIIGGGVVGTSIARFLSLYEVSQVLLEKNSDLCAGTSKANSGIAHAGYDPVPGTMKARMNVRGNELLRELAPELDIDLVNNMSMVISTKDDEAPLKALYNRGLRNGVPGMRLISGREVLELEPNITPEVKGALLLTTGCIVCPFSLTYAMAENAVDNGALMLTGREVRSIERNGNGFTVITDIESFTTRCVINAAGVNADLINDMVAPHSFTITPKRGEYVLLDHSEEGLVRSTIFQLPTDKGKGVLVTPTCHGNILIGPDSVMTDDREDTSTYADGLASVMESAGKSVPDINYRSIITSFSGVRASTDNGDFILNEPVKGFFNAAGIDSPGLTSAPAIGEYLSLKVAERLGLRKKDSPVLKRSGIVKAASLSPEERNLLIKKDHRYGNIICRCEEISEGEIVEAVRRGATTLDGVKRRVRAGMGRCQGGFCSVKVMEIIARETGTDISAVRKNGKGSEVVK